MALPLCLLVSVGGRRSLRPGPSSTLGSLGPSHQWRHKSRVSLHGPPCAHGVSGTTHGEVRNTGVLHIMGSEKTPSRERQSGIRRPATTFCPRNPRWRWGIRTETIALRHQAHPMGGAGGWRTRRRCWRTWQRKIWDFLAAAWLALLLLLPRRRTDASGKNPQWRSSCVMGRRILRSCRPTTTLEFTTSWENEGVCAGAERMRTKLGCLVWVNLQHLPWWHHLQLKVVRWARKSSGFLSCSRTWHLREGYCHDLVYL